MVVSSMEQGGTTPHSVDDLNFGGGMGDINSSGGFGDEFVSSGDDGPNILKWNGDGGDGPRYDVRLPTAMTVAAGQTAALRCRVYSLGNKTVGEVAFYWYFIR